MSEEAILREYLNIQNINKEFGKRVTIEKFKSIIDSLSVIDNCYLSREFHECDNIVFRNIKIVEECPAIAIRSNSNKIIDVYNVLKKHNELKLFADGFSFLYSDPINIDKILSYLEKQTYYQFLGKKTTLLTNGNYDDMVRISELFKEVFSQEEQNQFFSHASTVLSQKFDIVKNIYVLLNQMNIKNDRIIQCSSIFTRNDADKIKASLEVLKNLKEYFNSDEEYNAFIEENLSVLATSKESQLLEIISVISKYINKRPDVFKDVTLGTFIKDCSSIIGRGKASVIDNAFKTFEEYNMLTIINQGKRPLIEERGKLCSLIDLFIEEGLEKQIENHTSVFDKNYNTVFARIGYLKSENIFNTSDESIVKMIMAKDFHWKGSQHKKLDLYISSIFSTYNNAENQSKVLDNQKYDSMIKIAEKNNYPFIEITSDLEGIINELDRNYKATNNIYMIAGEKVSRPKVIRNLSILLQGNDIDINKALITSILYCKITNEEIIMNVKQSIDNLDFKKQR